MSVASLKEIGEWIRPTYGFVRTLTKKSGMTPLLAGCITGCSFGLSVIVVGLYFKVEWVAIIGAILLLGSVAFYYLAYFVHSLKNPDFVRSEEHVQRVLEIRLKHAPREYSFPNIQDTTVVEYKTEASQSVNPPLPILPEIPSRVIPPENIEDKN